ncbi:hypothetical protein [Glutamicibacter mishrai]|uniref:hypothetical protein n=1 Tax=Glutamicibacter mishrai TaxID=1775880 RepID=UPI003F78C9D2
MPDANLSRVNPQPWSLGERTKGKYDEEKRTDPEGHKRPIAKELVLLGTGFLPVSAFPFEYTDENQGQKQGDNCCGDQAAPS